MFSGVALDQAREQNNAIVKADGKAVVTFKKKTLLALKKSSETMFYVCFTFKVDKTSGKTFSQLGKKKNAVTNILDIEKIGNSK